MTEYSPKQMTLDEVQVALKKRLRVRTDTGYCYLDLRGKEWCGIGKEQLRNPAESGWPDKGELTKDEETAKIWIARTEQEIVKRVHQKLHGQAVDLTVTAAVEPFIEAIHAKLGPDHSTSSQRRSYLRVHIANGTLARERLATLAREKVQSWLDNMKVRDSKYGVVKTKAAEKSSQEAALRALTALFRFHFGHSAYPFKGARPNTEEAEKARRIELVKAGRADELFKQTVHTPGALELILLTARYIDTHPGCEWDFLHGGACRNLAPTIAIATGFAMRVSELVEVRESYITPDLFALIPGTKTPDAIRFLPIQDSVVPWLDVARMLKKGPVRPTHYLLRTWPDHDKLPNKDIYARRMGRVQEIARVKIDGARSHVFRKTNASMAAMAGLPPHEIKLMLGHAGVFGGATDVYIQTIRQLTRQIHRTYLNLPSPAELDQAIKEGWTPPSIGRRKRIESENAAA